MGDLLNKAMKEAETALSCDAVADGAQYACLGGVLRIFHTVSNEAENNAALLLVVYTLRDPSHLSGIALKFC